MVRKSKRKSEGFEERWEGEKEGEEKGKNVGACEDWAKGIGKREEDDEDEDEDEDDGMGMRMRIRDKKLAKEEKEERRESESAVYGEIYWGRGERREGLQGIGGRVGERSFGRNKDFLEGFHAAYSLSAPFKTVSYDFSLNHKKGRIMITRALELSSQFDNLTRKDIAKELAGLFGNEWSKEDGEIAKMLELGKVVGVNKFECIVNASKPEILETEALEVSKKFYPAVEEEISTGWGKEARKHERAHKRLLKAFESRS
ncbi:uncharacterized protein EAF02_005190 [Botrytis sinoallii]|uniref:uncharacterized protein n=1 Tax=Botrytis sinoallii TaxID=1463999 RepID=UPI001901A34A|nr:uncharacterized protein EAF02_005190 [Botrytis sinoallii]KAF7883270.1 hypothetical protein EAF02_005190 [Botrytis sinoallii]